MHKEFFMIFFFTGLKCIILFSFKQYHKREMCVRIQLHSWNQSIDKKRHQSRFVCNLLNDNICGNGTYDLPD